MMFVRFVDEGEIELVVVEVVFVAPALQAVEVVVEMDALLEL